MSGQSPGLVLPVDAVSDLSATTFPGFPGVFLPGEPVAISTLGFETEDEAWLKVEELGLPLEPADADPPSGTRPGNLPAGPEDLVARSSSPMPGLSESEFVELAASEREQAKEDPNFKPSPVVTAAAADTVDIVERRKAAFAGIKKDDLVGLAPEGLELTGTKDEMVAALVAAGVDAPEVPA